MFLKPIVFMGRSRQALKHFPEWSRWQAVRNAYAEIKNYRQQIKKGD